jgi:hypothetical protein
LSSSVFHQPAPRAIARRLFPLALLVALTAGCASNKYVIEFDEDYSRNIVKTPSWFPPKKLPRTVAEDEVLFRRGKPDFLRFWWRPDGSLISISDHTGQSGKEVTEQLQTMDQTWIYLRDKEEVFFHRNLRDWEVKPLSEVMELVCLQGDPSMRSKPRLVNGQLVETWQWIDFGMQAQIADDKVIEKSYFRGTGQGTWGMK